MHNVISPHFSFRVRKFAEMRTGGGGGGKGRGRIMVRCWWRISTQAAVSSAPLSLPPSFTPSKCLQLVLLTAELHEEPRVRHLGGFAWVCSSWDQVRWSQQILSVAMN